MNIVLTMLASLVLAGIIISPFFWLKFLKKKSVVKYLVVSSVLALILFIFFNTIIYKFVLMYVNSYEALSYFDGISMGGVYVVIFLAIFSPFIFNKIIGRKINLKNFFILISFSFIIFVSIFLFWVYVLLPKAFGDLLRHL